MSNIRVVNILWDEFNSWYQWTKSESDIFKNSNTGQTRLQALCIIVFFCFFSIFGKFSTVSKKDAVEWKFLMLLPHYSELYIPHTWFTLYNVTFLNFFFMIDVQVFIHPWDSFFLSSANLGNHPLLITYVFIMKNNIVIIYHIIWITRKENQIRLAFRLTFHLNVIKDIGNWKDMKKRAHIRQRQQYIDVVLSSLSTGHCRNCWHDSVVTAHPSCKVKLYTNSHCKEQMAKA